MQWRRAQPQLYIAAHAIERTSLLDLAPLGGWPSRDILDMMSKMWLVVTVLVAALAGSQAVDLERRSLQVGTATTVDIGDCGDFDGNYVVGVDDLLYLLSFYRAVGPRAANSRVPGGPTGPLRTPSRTPWILPR
jgi:hypothetical protein